jgi:hypothetical protein
MPLDDTDVTRPETGLKEAHAALELGVVFPEVKKVRAEIDFVLGNTERNSPALVLGIHTLLLSFDLAAETAVEALTELNRNLKGSRITDNPDQVLRSVIDRCARPAFTEVFFDGEA